MPRPPKLPQLLDRKIYKTGQTRGADDDEIYQNRVSRNSTVLIPHDYFKNWRLPEGKIYEKGSIVLISPVTYFGDKKITATLAKDELILGVNALVFYETKAQWIAHNPDSLRWTPAEQRTTPLGGQYVARISATTAAENGEKINRGFTVTSKKGAGIRVYEYASAETIEHCRLQLEALFWRCYDADSIVALNGMSHAEAATRKRSNFDLCDQNQLNDLERLTTARILNKAGQTICPLCLERLSAQGFFSRMAQAEGREVLDLTITQLNLFHIEELRLGEWNHRAYNLGWGHHHCNVVVKDSGITKTLDWMQEVIAMNIEEGHLLDISNKAT
jgi:ribosomal protein L34